MNEGLISHRYAKAMFHYARENGVEEQVYDKMKLFEDNYTSYPALQKALMSPMVSAENKERLLSSAIGIEPEGAYIRGIRLLVKNHREMYMRPIALMYQTIYREANGIVRAKITTAQTLPEETMERVRQMVARKTDKTVEYVYRIDPSIIGGFILDMGSEQWDASVRRELKIIHIRLTTPFGGNK